MFNGPPHKKKNISAAPAVGSFLCVHSFVRYMLPHAADAGCADSGVMLPRERRRGKQPRPANYPEMQPASLLCSPMQDCGLETTLLVNYLAKPLAAYGVIVPG